MRRRYWKTGLVLVLSLILAQAVVTRVMVASIVAPREWNSSANEPHQASVSDGRTTL